MLFGIVWVLLSQASQHGVGEVLIPLRHCWRDAFSVFAFALLSFVFGLLMRCLFLGSPPSPPRLLTRQLCGSGCVCRPEFHVIRLKNNSICLNRMIPLLHWGKSFDFMTPADSVRRLEMQNFDFTTVFVPVLMSLAAESCRSRAGVGTPAETTLQWEKG